jgi:hypothetical protein
MWSRRRARRWEGRPAREVSWTRNEGGVAEHASMNGSWPLMPTFSVFLPILTSRSLPLYFASMLMVMSRSLMVWSHLYGSAACSACSFARASASAFLVSSGGGEPAIVSAVWDVAWVLALYGPKFGVAFVCRGAFLDPGGNRHGRLPPCAPMLDLIRLQHPRPG